MAKGIPTLKKRPRRASGVIGPPTDRELIFKLMVEMNHMAQLQEVRNQLEARLSLDRRTTPRANRKECGVGLFVYQDSGKHRVTGYMRRAHGSV
jgi:hypothetical protein